MIALDTGDVIQGDAAVATKVDYTLFGVVEGVSVPLANGQLASSIGTLYTGPASKGTTVDNIILVNTDTSARAVNLYFLPSGGTARRLIPKDLSLAAGAQLEVT